jgi:AraC-like DNA-binding protein
MTIRIAVDSTNLSALRAEFLAAQEAERKPRTPEATAWLALAKQHGGNVDDMAQAQGVSRSTIYRRLRAEGLTRKVHNMRESFRMIARIDGAIGRVHGATRARTESAYLELIVPAWPMPFDSSAAPS